MRQPNLPIATAAATVGVSLLVAASFAPAATATPSARRHGGTPSAHRHGGCGSASARSLRQRRKLHSRCRTRGGRRKATARHTSHASPALKGQRDGGLARASAIASVLATPCQYTELTPEPGNLEQIRAAVLCLINRERAQNGETPLVGNWRLQQAAESHDSEMIADDYFQHVSPSGETPAERVRGTGYIPGPQVGYVIGENLAWGTLSLATPQSIVEAWIASPKHLANILEGQYRETGIGITPAVPAALSGGQPGATYSQEFGAIIR